MITERAKGFWLLALYLLTGLLAMAALTVVALAGSPDQSAGLSIALQNPFATVVEAVRTVCADGLIRGTFQYESDAAISGAVEASSSLSFPRWAGSGQVFYKTRQGAIAPAHFKGSRDKGAVTVRYVVEPEPEGRARVTIDAVFVEDGHHGRHPSQGFVETAEFGEIAKQLKHTGTRVSGPEAGSVGSEPEPRSPNHPFQDADRQQVAEPDRPASAVGPGRSAPLGRIYPRTEDDLKKALQVLGAFEDASLPALERCRATVPIFRRQCRHARPRRGRRSRVRRSCPSAPSARRAGSSA